MFSRVKNRCQRPLCYFAWGCFRYFSWKREPPRPCGCFASEGWWACLDSNQEPDRYERSTLAGNSSKISVSRSRSFTFVRVCSRGFCRITGGIEDRCNPPTGLDRTNGAGLLMSVVRGRPEVTGRGSNRRSPMSAFAGREPRRNSVT